MMRPLPIGTFLFLGALVLTQIVAFHSYKLSQKNARTHAEMQANFAKYKLTTALTHARSATKTLAYIVKRLGVPQNFDSVAHEIIASNKYIDALELTAQGKITHVYPLQGNEVAIGYDVLADTLTNKEALISLKKNELYFAGPFSLKQGYSAVVGRLPIFDNNQKFIGFSVVLIKTATLLDLIKSAEGEFKLVLAKANPSTGQMQFFSSVDFEVNDSGVMSVMVPDGDWILYVQATDSLFWIHKWLPISIIGVLLAFAVGFIEWYMAKEPIKLNRLYRFTSAVNHMMVNARDEKKVYEQICQIAIDIGKFRLAWVAGIDTDRHAVFGVAQAGDHEGYLQNLLPIDLRGKGKTGPIAKMLESQNIVYCNDIKFEPLMKPWAGEALKRGYRSSILLPIVQFGKIIGSFNLYSDSLNVFDKTELGLLEQVGRDISYTLENISKTKALEIARQQIELEKEKSNSIINSLPGIFYMYDRTGTFVRWNKNFEYVSGFGSAEIARMNPLDFFHSDDKSLLESRIEEVFTTGASDVSANFFTKDGKKIPYYFNGRKVEFEGIAYLIGMGVDITLRVEAEAEVKESINEIRRLNDYMQRMREEERTNISREIHDVLGQHLTGIKMDTIWLSKVLPDNADTVARIHDMNRLIDETITVVRRISAQLRPVILDDLGLVAALEWQALEFEKRTLIATSFISNEADLAISQRLATNIFRIYQESLTNVARHANATCIDSNLLLEGNKLLLTIADNGDGFQNNNMQRLRTLGIRGMAERAKLLNGEIAFLDNYPKGTIVKLILPLEHEVNSTYELSDN